MKYLSVIVFFLLVLTLGIGAQAVSDDAVLPESSISDIAGGIDVHVPGESKEVLPEKSSEPEEAPVPDDEPFYDDPEIPPEEIGNPSESDEENGMDLPDDENAEAPIVFEEDSSIESGLENSGVETPSVEPVSELDTDLIRVTVPESGNVLINPYQLPIATDDGESEDQIVSQPQCITNYSDIPVSVWVRTQSRISEESDAVFVPEPPQPDTTQKEIFLYAEFLNNEQEAWSDAYYGAQNQILLSDPPSDDQKVMELDAGGAEGLFRLFGQTTRIPADPWDTNDSFEVVFTFTFLPVQDETETLAEMWNELPKISEGDTETSQYVTESSWDDSQTLPDTNVEPDFDPELAMDTEQETDNTSDFEPEDDPVFSPVPDQPTEPAFENSPFNESE